jgi:hypothetical protein
VRYILWRVIINYYVNMSDNYHNSSGKSVFITFIIYVVSIKEMRGMLTSFLRM